MDLLRQNARQVVNEARHQYVSPYEEWSVEELKELLVEYRIPLRDSANATHETLVRICDEVFGADIADSESSKELRRQLSIEDVVRMETAARMIQRAFFRRQALKRQLRLQYQRQRSSSSSYDYDCEGSDYTYYDDPYSSTSGDGHSRVCSQDSFRRHSMLRRINERGDDYDEEIEVYRRRISCSFLGPVAQVWTPLNPFFLFLSVSRSSGSSRAGSSRKGSRGPIGHIARAREWTSTTGRRSQPDVTALRQDAASSSISGTKDGPVNSVCSVAASRTTSSSSSGAVGSCSSCL